MDIYFAPALISLMFNLLVLAYVFRGGRVSNMFLSLIIVFAVHNAIEITGYFNYDTAEPSDVLFRLYYVATIYVVLYMLLHALSVSNIESAFIMSIPIIAATALSGLILFSDIVVSGLYSIGYSVTAITGSYYWLFALYMLGALGSGFLVTFIGYRNAASQLGSVRCLLSLWALTPISLAFLLATIFKIAGISINATGLVPIATALFLAIVLKTESKHKLSDLRRVMPLSIERKTTNNFMDLLDAYIQNSNTTNVYKDLQSGIEKEIIMYSLKKCDYNITYTAKMMGLKNRSTLYSMMNRLKIDLTELKQETASDDHTQAKVAHAKVPQAKRLL